MDMREHHLGYRETVRKHWENSRGKEANFVKQIQRWERIFLEEGAEGLMKERRGRAGYKKCDPQWSRIFYANIKLVLKSSLSLRAVSFGTKLSSLRARGAFFAKMLEISS